MICHICGLSNGNAETCVACRAILLKASDTGSLESKALPSGTQLLNDAYLIGSVLNVSNFAVTYLGRHAAERRYVVVKEFFPAGCSRNACQVQPARDLDEDYDAAKTLFLAQGQMWSRFRHANLAVVQECFEENNSAYIVMEFVRGKTLQQTVGQNGALDEETSLRAVRQIGLGLERLHREGLVHCDVQPANVMISSAAEASSRSNTSRTKNTVGRVVLIDFGFNRPLCKSTEDSALQTLILSEPIRTGTPGFAALEQYGTTGILNESTDIYGLGATAYYLLTGCVPIPAPDRAQGNPLSPPHEINPMVSRDASDAVMWALELQGDRRPRSVPDFLDRWPSLDAPTPTRAAPQTSLPRKSARVERTRFDVSAVRHHRVVRWAPRVALASFVGVGVAVAASFALQGTSQNMENRHALLPASRLEAENATTQSAVTISRPLQSIQREARPIEQVAERPQATPVVESEPPKVLSPARTTIKTENESRQPEELKPDNAEIVARRAQNQTSARTAQFSDNSDKQMSANRSTEVDPPFRASVNKARSIEDELITPRRRSRVRRERPQRRERRLLRVAKSVVREPRQSRRIQVIREAGLPQATVNEAGLPPS